MDVQTSRLTKAYINLDHLTHNLRLLQMQVDRRPMWPVIKANAYGHDATIVAPHLVELGYKTLGVADVAEAIALIESGVDAIFIVLSATLPEHSEALVAYGCEPVVCTFEMAESLAREAAKRDKCINVHLKIDTGMGRVGIQPEEMQEFLERARAFPGLHVHGIMSHFPRADEADKSYSLAQLERFQVVADAAQAIGIQVRHMANSAAILDLPGSYLDAVRPGIAMYGLRPSWNIKNPQVHALKPALRWETRITFLKEVPAGTGLSYGHAFHTRRPSLIATVPIGYGDGLSRNLSNNLDMLVGGVRCPQVGRITMDMCLLDVTPLRGKVEVGDEVIVIGSQGEEEVSADELAAKLGTINYEVVTCIAQRVPRVPLHSRSMVHP